MCVSFVNGLVGVERLLECTHEEADDQIFPCTPRNKDRKLWKSCIASPDTYICIRTTSFLQTEVL